MQLEVEETQEALRKAGPLSFRRAGEALKCNCSRRASLGLLAGLDLAEDLPF